MMHLPYLAVAADDLGFVNLNSAFNTSGHKVTDTLRRILYFCYPCPLHIMRFYSNVIFAFCRRRNIRIDSNIEPYTIGR